MLRVKKGCERMAHKDRVPDTDRTRGSDGSGGSEGDPGHVFQRSRRKIFTTKTGSDGTIQWET